MIKKVSKRLNTEHLNAMVKALRAAKVFKIERNHNHGWVIATHKGVEVFRSLRAGAVDLHLIRHADNLFT